MTWPIGVPPPCAREVYEKGKGVCVVAGSPEDVERWVQMIAHAASANLDWHYHDGKASIFHLGDAISRQRVLWTIRNKRLRRMLKGHVFKVENPAVYRF